MSKSLEILHSKILDKERLLVKLTDWKEENKKIVFTNGCFDLIHLGHIEVIAFHFGESQFADIFFKKSLLEDNS